MNYKIYVLKDGNGKIRYVGYTKVSLQKRLEWHIRDAAYYKHTYYRARWLRKLLSNNIIPVIELIEDGLTEESAKKKEIEYIKFFGPGLVNRTIGGDGNSNPSVSTRKKISRSLKRGYKNGTIKRRKVTDLVKNKISISVKKAFAACPKRSLTEKEKKSISISRLEYIKTHPMKSGKDHPRFGKGKRVIQIKDGEVIKVWRSINSVEEIGLSKGNVSSCCNGRHKTYKGYVWKYED